MAFAKIDTVANAVLGDEDRADGEFAPVAAFLVRHAFHFNGAAFLTQDSAAGMREFDEDGDDGVEALPEGERSGLHGEKFAVAIDDETAETIGFAVDEASSAGGVGVAQIATQVDRGLEAAAEKRFVNCFGSVPGVKANAKFAGAVEQAASDEVAFVGNEIDDVAVGGHAFDFGDGGIEDPGMTAEEGLRLARPQPNLCDAETGGGFSLLRIGFDGGSGVRHEFFR